MLTTSGDAKVCQLRDGLRETSERGEQREGGRHAKATRGVEHCRGDRREFGLPEIEN